MSLRNISARIPQGCPEDVIRRVADQEFGADRVSRDVPQAIVVQHLREDEVSRIHQAFAHMGLLSVEENTP